jgi:membrane-associated PAP2 superfamily phosphatase
MDVIHLARCDERPSASARCREALRAYGQRLLVALAVLLPLTAVFRLTEADLMLSRPFYGGPADPWPAARDQPFLFLYDYGPLVGAGLGVGGLVIALASLLWTRLRPAREAGFFLAALLILGPGLFVNGVFKPQWGRPRPRQLAVFGGGQGFAAVWDQRPAGNGKSFTSGHASMGFYLMGPAFLLYPRRRGWALAFFLLGSGGGTLLGLTRLVQGAHFASDILWSGGAVYLSGLTLRLANDCWRAVRGAETGRPEAGQAFHAAGPQLAALPQDAQPLLAPSDIPRRSAA